MFLAAQDRKLQPSTMAAPGTSVPGGVSLIGKNLTDETTSNFANDALGGPLMGGSYFRMVDPPRSVALQATLRY